MQATISPANNLKTNIIPIIIPGKNYRVQSIDLLRGAVMIIMALDHVRDFFHTDAFLYDPTDLDKTSVALFFTRWITHFCAPAFIFLSGTSAFLVGQRKGKKALSKFLLTRGLWLVLLEFTIVNFAWFFDPFFTTLGFLVIWALGVSMIALAALIWLPVPIILAISLAMIVGHNFLDNIQIPGNSLNAFGWSLLHQFQIFNWSGRSIFVMYPVIPWIGVMSAGYCLGTLYIKEFNSIKRKKLLLSLGIVAVACFIGLRYLNIYGDPSPWTEQTTITFTLLSFLNTTKYPPSLLYLLMTLGPSLIFLAFTEKSAGFISDKIKIVGRVPMFYYLFHLYFIHIAAVIAAALTGFGWQPAILFNPEISGYGFSLGVVYLVWAALVVVLYFLCASYDRYKRANAEKWWLSYL
jgi:uncharacterized membrane protein